MSDPVPSYRASFTPVVFRYNAPQERVEGVEAFYASPLLSSVNLSVLSKYQVDYLIAPVDKELISQLDLTPELFIPLHRNARWSLYQVAQPVVPTDVANANDLFREGDWQVAIDTYNAILVESPDSSLARTGLGMLLELLNKPKKAVQELEEAVRLEPRNLQAHYHLAGVYNQLGMADESRAHAEAAGPLIGGGNR
jgi:tetratricopeptide (TPR) repeat protein